nr:retrovirus-related Pol polyprotein from transposon TNT 1-94 [Tanacetum cinerariifolium]
MLDQGARKVAVVEKIYKHDSLTFNDTVACEVLSKWKAGLKEDMDVRSDVCVLSNRCSVTSPKMGRSGICFRERYFIMSLHKS